jgi:hypothetical protein
MTERPILFSAPMVRALLDGSKTQTRRPLKVQPFDVLPMNENQPGQWVGLMEREPKPQGTVFRCKFGVPGDRLWVRESFWGCDLPGYGDQPCVVYDDEWAGKEYQPAAPRPWGRKFGRIPSIHMPRDCSRILLEIVSVRVERLNDCSEADAKAEGVDPATCVHEYYDGYSKLWESINGAGSWAANPWVWVVEFKRVMP